MNILFLSPHTDDVEIGCGGTLIRFLEEGNKIFWVVFSTAEESLPINSPKDTLKKEFLNVIDNLNLEDGNYKIFNFRVRNLEEHRQEILEELINIRDKFNPQIVIGPSLNDFHQDHQVISKEMIRAFKTTSNIICFELPWNHITFNTQLFVKLKEYHIDQKCRLLRNYNSQLEKKRSYFSKEFIYGLAKTRGIQCDSEYAEAFEVMRWTI